MKQSGVRAETADRARPVVVIGMHRSGTSLVSRILRHLGLNMGSRVDSSDESYLFQMLNRWALRELPGSWEFPIAAAGELDDPAVVEELAAAFGPVVESRWRRLHAGIGPRAEGMDRWGWKDPRTSILLPAWERVFPHMRVVWVMRHGVAVADSLVRRRALNRDQQTETLRYKAARLVTAPARPTRMLHLRSRSFEGALQMWEEYNQVIESHLDATDLTALQVRYETLLAEPERVITSLSSDLSIDAEPQRVQHARHLIDSTRSDAFRGRPEAAEFDSTVTERLSRWGY